MSLRMWLVQDEVNGYDNESPIVPIVRRINKRRSVAPKITAVVSAILLSGGLFSVLGEAAYDIGRPYDKYDDPIIPHNAIAFTPIGLPGFAIKDKETGGTKVEAIPMPVTPIILSGAALLGYGISIIGTSIATGPNGVRRSAKKDLKKQKRDLQ